MHHRSAQRRMRRSLPRAAALVALVAITACTSSTPTLGKGVWKGVDSGPKTSAELDGVIGRLGQLDRGPGDCTDIPYVANEVLVYVSSAARPRVEEIATIVAGVLRSGEIATEKTKVSFNPETSASGLGGPVFRITVDGKLSLAALASAREQLTQQLTDKLGSELADQVTIDVDHIGPFLPVGTFHPAEAPAEAKAADAVGPSAGGTHSVLVVDSPAPNDPKLLSASVTSAASDPTVDYDGWGEQWSGTVSNVGADHKLDFVAGHGPFVVDVIHRAAPSATVVLSSVAHDAAKGWPTFLYSEADLVAAIERGFGATAADFASGRKFTKRFDIVNFSLGLTGCPGDMHPILERELRDLTDPASYSKEVTGTDEPPLFVAAAGNDGGTKPPHYPAAFAAGGAGIDPTVASHTVAVGALDPANHAQQACYSNAAPYVLGWAVGTASASFPKVFSGKTGFASWAGTSFATARVTGLLADALRQPYDVWNTGVLSGTGGVTRSSSIPAAPKPCGP